MSASDTGGGGGGGGFRHRVREKLGNLRRKSRSSSKNANAASDLNRDLNLPEAAGPGQSTAIECTVTSLEAEQETAISVPHPSGQQHKQPEDIEDAAPSSMPDLSVSVKVSSVPSDLWSAAYREAVENLGKDIDVAILKGDSVAELFKHLENMDKDTTQESAFLRGVKYLHSLQVPLERFKLALDLSSPLTSMEPTSIVFGVVRGVTAVSFFFFFFWPC